MPFMGCGGCTMPGHCRELLALPLVLVLALLLAACGKEAGNPAPPRIDTAADLPQQTSAIVVPVEARLAELEAGINKRAPVTLWQIDQFEPRCIPARRLTICPIAKKECKDGVCRKVGCKFGLQKTKVTPDISCRIVGQVTRGRIRLGGSGNTLALSMPVTAVVSARDVGGIIKRKTATGAANVRATVKLSVDRNWAPVAKVAIAYDWTEPPGIDFLGKRIKFAQKADAKLQGVIAGLERSLPREIAKTQTRPKLEEAWRQGFATIMLNRDKPPAWMRVTPQRLGFGGYRVQGGKLEMILAAEALTETFVGNRPANPVPTPLPPPSAQRGPRGLHFYIPVLADFAQLEPVVERTLVKLAKKGIVLKGIGPVDAEFGKVTIYATEGGRLAVGITATARARRSALTETHGEVWLSAIPYNEVDSQLIRVRDLKIATRTDRKAVDLLISLVADPQVLEQIRLALTHDFVGDYDKVLVAARKAIAQRREGDFLLSAQADSVSNGLLKVTGQGLFLPVQVTGSASIAYSPLRRGGR
jgi:hypothetical protein